MKLTSLFRRDKAAAPAGPLPIEVAGPEAEEEFLADALCECAGPWILGERTVVAEREGREIFDRKVMCQICGTTASYPFVCPAGAYRLQTQDDEEAPRIHHYLFVHRVLPQIFFDNPRGCLDVMSGPGGGRRLVDLWEQVGEQEAADEPLPATSLQIAPLRFHGRRAVVIRFPDAQRAVEGQFAALVDASDDDSPRYFVLEKKESESPSSHDEAIGMLCEWLEGGRRRNHGRVIPLRKEDFEHEVADQLAEEQERLAKGAARTTSSWDLAGKEDLSELMFAEDFRLQPCIFGFHLLPNALLRPGVLAADAGLEEAEELVSAAWAEATQLAAEAGEPRLPADEKPAVSIRQVGACRLLVVNMASAFSAPEPLLIAAALANPRAIFLVESAGARADQVLVTSIDAAGMHAILGTLKDPNLDGFIEHFDANCRPEVSTEGMPDTMKPLFAYAAISQRMENLA